MQKFLKKNNANVNPPKVDLEFLCGGSLVGFGKPLHFKAANSKCAVSECTPGVKNEGNALSVRFEPYGRFAIFVEYGLPMSKLKDYGVVSFFIMAAADCKLFLNVKSLTGKEYDRVLLSKFIVGDVKKFSEKSWSQVIIPLQKIIPMNDQSFSLSDITFKNSSSKDCEIFLDELKVQSESADYEDITPLTNSSVKQVFENSQLLHRLEWDAYDIICQYLELPTILSLRLVSKSIYEAMLLSDFFIDLVIDQLYQSKNSRKALQERFPNRDSYFYLKVAFFERNLIKNPSGESGMNGWVLNGEFAVENWGCLPGRKACFVTSYSLASKNQTIRLESLIDLQLLDQYQPPIHICDHICARMDCGSIYFLEVHLLDKNGVKVETYSSDEIECPQNNYKYTKIEHTFKNYGPNVREILFIHGGKDMKFWGGWYGARMSSAGVRFEWLDCFDKFPHPA